MKLLKVRLASLNPSLDYRLLEMLIFLGLNIAIDVSSILIL